VEALELVSSAVCAATLGWSAVAKLRSPGRAAVSLVRFGLARRARRTAGRALGVLEGAVALALVAAPTSLVPLAVAAALFAAFCVLIARALRAGQRFDCGCLGAGETLGRPTLLRALALLAVALAGVTADLTGAGGDAAAADRLVAVVLGSLIVVQAWAATTLRRLHPFDPALRGMP
jgi:hypothetical protein